MINVIGLGYIGLPTALMMASVGNEVIGTDYSEEIVNQLNMGSVPFEENGIVELYADAVDKGIKFTTEYQKTDMYIITVPTPYIKSSKKIDPKYIISAVTSVLNVAEKGAVIAIESTVSPGTMDKFVKPLIEEKGFKLGEDIHLVHTPERILPGNMIHELKHNSRTIGTDNVEVGERIKKVYQTFCESEIAITDIRTAEMTKVVENTFRDINIAFANELAKICRSDDLDVYEIIRIANKHPRVDILNPGPGVGGHCISVDPWFLVGDYPGLTNLILTARHTNDSMPEFVLNRAYTIMKENGLTDFSRIGLYGLTYKANVDDVRESPTFQLLEKMEEHLSAGLKVYDPLVKKNIVENQYDNFNTFLNDVDFIIVMVGHNHIIENEAALTGKIVLDTQNILTIDNRYFL
ncbi:nucleotide sugar dehydrogenase [Carnobacterium funditum]|uniref:nucleotide sugar dehydrogenase n=1 Tax=Carnobacterium funditum TaxID=2752 RepID=UPI00054FEAB2|nr:nucleotide sugar dehydrogenase [Carnobacterium funditum]